MPEAAPRRATAGDVAALVQLRAQMIETIFGDPGEDEWRASCARVLEERLADTERFAAFVVDGPNGVPVSSGVGWVEQHLPGPRNPSGRVGSIASMSTLPEHRRQGHGGAVLQALLDWFASMGVQRVHLHAAPAGERLYRSAGFVDRRMPALSWSAPQQ